MVNHRCTVHYKATAAQILTKSQVMIIWDHLLRWPAFTLVSTASGRVVHFCIWRHAFSGSLIGSHAVAGCGWCCCKLFLWHYCVLLQRVGVLKGYHQLWQEAQGCSGVAWKAFKSTPSAVANNWGYLCRPWKKVYISPAKPVFVNLSRSPGIDSQPGGLVRQPYFS